MATRSRLPVSGNHLKCHLVAFRFFHDNAVPMERIIKLLFAVAWGKKIIKFISSKDDSPNCPFGNDSFRSRSASAGASDKLAPAGSAVGPSFSSSGPHYPPIDAQDPGTHLPRFGVALTSFALCQSNFPSPSFPIPIAPLIMGPQSNIANNKPMARARLLASKNNTSLSSRSALFTVAWGHFIKKSTCVPGSQKPMVHTRKMKV